MINFESNCVRVVIIIGQEARKLIKGCLGVLIALNAIDSNVKDIGEPLHGQYLRAVNIIRQGSIFEKMAL